jgi:hypothetical protein
MSRYLGIQILNAALWTDDLEQNLLDHIIQIDTNNPNPNWMDRQLIPKIIAARKIQNLARGILTRNKIHFALLSADPDVFANAVLCCSRKRKRC